MEKGGGWLENVHEDRPRVLARVGLGRWIRKHPTVVDAWSAWYAHGPIRTQQTIWWPYDHINWSWSIQDKKFHSIFQCSKWFFLWKSYQICVQMISYFAQVYIVDLHTILTKRVFIFFGRQLFFSISRVPKVSFLWRTYNIFVAKLDQINFLKY